MMVIVFHATISSSTSAVTSSHETVSQPSASTESSYAESGIARVSKVEPPPESRAQSAIGCVHLPSHDLPVQWSSNPGSTRADRAHSRNPGNLSHRCRSRSASAHVASLPKGYSASRARCQSKLQRINPAIISGTNNRNRFHFQPVNRNRPRPRHDHRRQSIT